MTKATQKDVPVDLAAVGNVEASTSIAVRSQVTGQLEEVHFREGDFVKKGDLLFSIDRRPLEAAVEQARANLVRDQALLNQAEAQLARDAANAEYQQLAAERQAQLASRGIVSRDMGDQARAQADATAAVVKADRAAVESAKAQLTVQQAAIDAARTQLSYTSIRSPIDGRTGDLLVKAGNLVTANQSQLMTIAQVEPIFVTFAVPAVHLPTIKRALAEDKTLSVVATPQDAEAQAVTGDLAFVDNVVDPSTDTIKLKGTFVNRDHKLWPGQFARVSLRLTTLSNATVVPQQAVQIGQDGQFVFVVTDESTAEQRPVTVGRRVDDEVVIEKGLKPGETVVTEGQLRLEQGTRGAAADANPGGGGPGARPGRGPRGAGSGGGGEPGGGRRGGGRRGQDSGR
jgi:multidrug efflux system membrane fusion protein